MIPWSKGKSPTWDVRVINYLADSPGDAAEIAANQKVDKYSLISATLTFQPVALKPWALSIHLALRLCFRQINHFYGTALLARLNAVAAQHSSDWLHALPIASCSLRLDDDAVRVAVGLKPSIHQKLSESFFSKVGRRAKTFGKFYFPRYIHHRKLSESLC